MKFDWEFTTSVRVFTSSDSLFTISPTTRDRSIYVIGPFCCNKITKGGGGVVSGDGRNYNSKRTTFILLRGAGSEVSNLRCANGRDHA